MLAEVFGNYLSVPPSGWTSISKTVSDRSTFSAIHARYKGYLPGRADFLTRILKTPPTLIFQKHNSQPLKMYH